MMDGKAGQGTRTSVLVMITGRRGKDKSDKKADLYLGGKL